jgi:restriction system protein
MLEDLSKQLTQIADKANYHFVRTTDGDFYREYTDLGFISIGWNEISSVEIEKNDKEAIKVKISRIEKLDTSLSKGKSKITSIYNKLRKFYSIKQGDFVIIPSKNSTYFSFGIVEDEKPFDQTALVGKCDHIKRRKVSWFKTVKSNSLDPYFLQIKSSRHAITNINQYSKYVDRMVDNLYRKNDCIHYVIDVKSTEDIDLELWTNFFSSFKKVLSQIDNTFQFDEDVQKCAIKMNVQSPGKIELILKKGMTLAVFSLVLSLTSCSNDDEIDRFSAPQEIKNFVKVNKDSLDQLIQSTKSLGIQPQ